MYSLFGYIIYRDNVFTFKNSADREAGYMDGARARGPSSSSSSSSSACTGEWIDFEYLGEQEQQMLKQCLL